MVGKARSSRGVPEERREKREEASRIETLSHFLEFTEVFLCNAEEGEQDGGTRQSERTDALAGAAAAGGAGAGAACCDGRPGVCSAWV